MPDIWRVDTKYKVSLQEPSRSFIKRDESAIKGFKSAAGGRKIRGKKAKEARELLEQFKEKTLSTISSQIVFIDCTQ